MPDKESPPSPSAASGPPAAGRSGLRTMLIVFLCLGLVAVGYLVGGRSGGAPAAADAATEPTAPAEPEIGEIVGLEAINVNLADGHYLRIAVSLGLVPAVDAAHVETYPTAPASDLVLTTFAGRSMEELAEPDGRERARQQLSEALAEAYGSEVAAVYFTEFVMQ